MFSRSFAIILLSTAVILVWLTFPVFVAASEFRERFATVDPPGPLPPIHFQDAEGRDLKLEDFRGHYVLLNLWATWCGPCIKELPSLDELSKAFSFNNGAHDIKGPHPDLTVVALAEDRDGLIAIQSFYQRHNISHLPVYLDDTGRMPFLLHTRALPTTILINPQGKEIGRIMGDADWSTPSVVAFLLSKMSD